MVRELLNFAGLVGHSELVYICDNEQTLRQLQRMVVNARLSMGLPTCNMVDESFQCKSGHHTIWTSAQQGLSRIHLQFWWTGVWLWQSFWKGKSTLGKNGFLGQKWPTKHFHFVQWIRLCDHQLERPSAFLSQLQVLELAIQDWFWWTGGFDKELTTCSWWQFQYSWGPQRAKCVFRWRCRSCAFETFGRTTWRDRNHRDGIA